AIILDQKKKSQDIYRVGDSVQGAEIRQILRAKVILRHDEKDEILTMVEGDDMPHPTAKVDSKSRRPTRGIRDRFPARPATPEAADDGQLEEASEDITGIEEQVIPIDQNVLQDSISNLNQLMTEVRIRPYFRQGKPEGLIVSQIQAQSVFQQLGLLNGDIISSVNGKKISSPEQAFQLYNSLKQGSQVSIAIVRRGQKKLLTYEIR
ncbi:MAG: type II secretion system protein GspC, partial [Desulfobulbales bacterium]|nr:type II secretion system protein GspC [Desulfobulbales bacterium]